VFRLIFILLCGDPADTSVTDALLPALARCGGVRYFSASRVLRRGEGAGFLVFETEKIPEIEIGSGILLLKNGIRPQEPVRIPPGFLCVLETKNAAAAALLKSSACAAVTCGTGQRDTLSVAGLESAGATLSLQRNLTTLAGKTLEPHDFNVRFTAERSPHQALFVSAALLISGADSAAGFVI
jgi:hypothetical protein